MSWINKSWIRKVYLPLEKVTRLIPDKPYLQMIYRIRMGKKLDLKHPQTFNEKLQWLKLYDRKPVYTTMVDKYEAKKYVASIIGEEYIIPTLGVWNRFDEIDFDKLPEQFVLKCTHDSGGLVIVRDKKTLDKVAAKKKVEGSLRRNFYWKGREWPYKNVKPRIIAEKYIEDSIHDNQEENGNNHQLVVFKFFTFDGKAYMVQVIKNDKQYNETVDYYDPFWTKLELKQNFPNSIITMDQPRYLEEMLGIAEKLSQGFPFLRVDLYASKEGVFFSEFTFFSDNGTEPFHPDQWDRILGEQLSLPVLEK